MLMKIVAAAVVLVIIVGLVYLGRRIEPTGKSGEE